MVGREDETQDDIQEFCLKNWRDGSVMSATKREKAKGGMDLDADRNRLNSVLELLNSKCLWKI